MARGFRHWISYPRRHPWRAASSLFVGVALLGVVAYKVGQSFEFNDHLDAARTAEAQFAFDRAREHLVICIRLRPGDREAHLLAARTARRAGDYATADAELDTHHKLVGATDADEMLERAMLIALTSREGDTQVESYLQSALKADHPQSTIILETLVQECLRFNRLKEAIYWEDQLLKRDPHDVPGLVANGQLYEQGGKLEDAMQSYRKAVEIQPEYTEARLRLAQLLYRKGQVAEAATQFQLLYTRQPHDQETVLGLARCRRTLNELAKADSLLRDLLAEHPNDAKALAERGWVALENKQPEMAEQWLRQAVNAMPWDREVNYHLALCLQQLNKPADAEHYFKRSKEIDVDMKRLVQLMQESVRSPSDPNLRLEAGQICLRNGRDQQGLSWFEGTLQINPNHQATHEALAKYFERVGQTERAAFHRQKAGMAP